MLFIRVTSISGRLFLRKTWNTAKCEKTAKDAKSAKQRVRWMTTAAYISLGVLVGAPGGSYCDFAVLLAKNN